MFEPRTSRVPDRALNPLSHSSAYQRPQEPHIYRRSRLKTAISLILNNPNLVNIFTCVPYRRLHFLSTIFLPHHPYKRDQTNSVQQIGQPWQFSALLSDLRLQSCWLQCCESYLRRWNCVCEYFIPRGKRKYTRRGQAVQGKYYTKASTWMNSQYDRKIS